LITGWELLVDYGYVDFIFVSKPSAVLMDFISLLKSGELLAHLSVTLEEVILGFAIGTLCGILLGLLFHWKENIARVFMPYIYFLYSTPYIALVPLLILWFGIDIVLKIISVVITVAPIMVIQTYEGTRTVDKSFVNLLKSMKFSDHQIISKVTFPASLFFIFTGLKIAFGRAMVIAIVAEFQASRIGIGYLIQYSASIFNTSSVIVGIIITAFISVVAIRLIILLEKYVIKWRPNQNY